MLSALPGGARGGERGGWGPQLQGAWGPGRGGGGREAHRSASVIASSGSKAGASPRFVLNNVLIIVVGAGLLALDLAPPRRAGCDHERAPRFIMHSIAADQ